MESQNTLIDNDNSSFNLALNKLFNSDDNLFIIGKAGTGKSTFLKHVVQKNIKKTIVLAPTGVAAMNVKGQTIHSFFKIPRQIIFPNDSIFESKKSIYQYFNGIEYNDDVIKKIELIIIDEISMVRADLIDIVDIILRKIRDNDRPFGGVQVVLIGDLYQLSPVLPIEDKQRILDYYGDYYIFNSNVFKNIDFVNIEFTKVYRQKGDNDYLDILSRIRKNTTSFQDFKLLNSRVISDLDHEINEINIILTGTNRIASAFNENFLNKNSNQLHVFDANISGDFSKSDFIGEQSLKIKIGCKVMCLVNNSEENYYNGKIGVVKRISNNCITIEDEFGNQINIRKFTWEKYNYKFNKLSSSIERIKIGSFEQYPLKLAWAITIHKSQGLTLSNIVIYNRDIFVAGQLYVALSRCKSLENLKLIEPITNKNLFNNETIDSFIESLLFISEGNSSSEELEEKVYTFYLNKDYEKLIDTFKQYSDNEIKDFIKVFFESREIIHIKDSNNLMTYVDDLELKYTFLKKKVHSQDELLNVLKTSNFEKTSISKIEKTKEELNKLRLSEKELKKELNKVSKAFGINEEKLKSEKAEKRKLISENRKCLENFRKKTEEFIELGTILQSKEKENENLVEEIKILKSQFENTKHELSKIKTHWLSKLFIK